MSVDESVKLRRSLSSQLSLMGQPYWTPIKDMLAQMVRQQTINEADLNLLCLTDSIDEAAAHIQTHAIDRFGLRKRQDLGRSRLSGEH
jgi:predicted Rossmann-fold nucleotide-binding protein